MPKGKSFQKTLNETLEKIAEIKVSKIEDEELKNAFSNIQKVLKKRALLEQKRKIDEELERLG